ncbi:uncharacterized protein SCHCODRAFT_02556751 [Schizophyllum commune H4-8]|nr:uncharacterized protein SCHCODRAFT_02556751 [Schizophyllum commune H4-8]KAI5886155.1 hypothetical protein SCHCODRAFT_02556751 [Schizophyllum commune H4-8]
MRGTRTCWSRPGDEGGEGASTSDCPALARGAPGDFGDGNPQFCARAMPRDTGKLINDSGSEQKTHVALARTIARITAGREDVGGALPVDQAHPARLEALDSGWDGYAVVLDVWLDLMNTGLARLERACSANLYGSGSCHAGMIPSAPAPLLSRASLGLRRHSLALLLALYRRDCPARSGFRATLGSSLLAPVLSNTPRLACTGVVASRPL